MIGAFGNATEQVPAEVSVKPSTIILTAQAQAATITHGQEETATAQVITGDGTTFDNSTGMGDDTDSNAVAAAAQLEHLIPAYQQDYPTPVLRTDIAHSQGGDQSSESDETGSENSDSDEERHDPIYARDEDNTDDDKAYFARWYDTQERDNMVAATFGDDSDEEDMTDLVGSDNESDDGNQSYHGNDDYAFQQIADAMSEYHLGRQEGTLIYTNNDITTISKNHVFPKIIPYANVLLAHPQYQAMPNWSLLNPEQDSIDMAREYFSIHKMAFNNSRTLKSLPLLDCIV
jgi:hypothetical protein